MKTSIVAITLTVGMAFLVSLALANPAMLPKHPGYPADNAVSPVTGQPLANDPGETNMTGEKAALQGAGAEDVHVMQNLSNPDDQRILEKPGAGLLPKVQGPQIKIEPPVKEATKMK